MMLSVVQLPLNARKLHQREFMSSSILPEMFGFRLRRENGSATGVGMEYDLIEMCVNEKWRRFKVVVG